MWSLERRDGRQASIPRMPEASPSTRRYIDSYPSRHTLSVCSGTRMCLARASSHWESRASPWRLTGSGSVSHRAMTAPSYARRHANEVVRARVLWRIRRKTQQSALFPGGPAPSSSGLAVLTLYVPVLCGSGVRLAAALVPTTTNLALTLGRADLDEDPAGRTNAAVGRAALISPVSQGQNAFGTHTSIVPKRVAKRSAAVFWPRSSGVPSTVATAVADAARTRVV